MRGGVRGHNVGDVGYTVPLVGPRVTHATTGEMMTHKLTHTRTLRDRIKIKKKNNGIYTCIHVQWPVQNNLEGNK